MIPFLQPEQHWECPNCTHTWVTHNVDPVSVMHDCRGLRGLSTPMVPEGTRCKQEVKVREDYVGKEILTTDGDGKPIQSVITTRDDGEDCTVYAPCARGGAEA